MSDMKLTNERMMTFVGHEKIGTLKAAEKLMEFGDKQNLANEALAANVNDLIKRVCALEDANEVLVANVNDLKKRVGLLEEKERRSSETVKKLTGDLSMAKRELDRVRLTSKLNSSSIERLNNIVRNSGGKGAKAAEEEEKPESADK